MELPKQTTEPFLDKKGSNEFSFTAESLTDIMHLDNRDQVKGRMAWEADQRALNSSDKPNEFVNDQYPDCVLSSRLIVEKFGGVDGLARGLRTDLRSGLKETPAELASRK